MKNYSNYIENKDNFTTYTGVILFDPVNRTKKQKNQADWKRVAMIMFDGEVAEFYAWLLEKRYGLKLNKPLRGAHISFINDSLRDIKTGLGVETEEEADEAWEKLREKWDGQKIDVVLDVDIKTNGQHYWLIVPHSQREEIQSIRAEIGLGKPYFGLHMSIGYANERNIEQSMYVSKILNNIL